MNNKLTYQRKLKYLGIGAVITFFVCYQLSFSKAINEFRKYSQFQETEKKEVSNSSSFAMLQSKNRMLDQLLNRFILDTSNQSKNLLGLVGPFCDENKLHVMEYKPMSPALADSLTTITRSLTVEGGYSDCLRLIYFLEMQSAAGRVASVQFKSYSPPGTSVIKLSCTIFIQNLIL